MIEGARMVVLLLLLLLLLLVVLWWWLSEKKESRTQHFTLLNDSGVAAPNSLHSPFTTTNRGACVYPYMLHSSPHNQIAKAQLANKPTTNLVKGGWPGREKAALHRSCNTQKVCVTFRKMKFIFFFPVYQYTSIPRIPIVIFSFLRFIHIKSSNRK